MLLRSGNLYIISGPTSPRGQTRGRTRTITRGRTRAITRGRTRAITRGRTRGEVCPRGMASSNKKRDNNGTPEDMQARSHRNECTQCRGAWIKTVLSQLATSR